MSTPVVYLKSTRKAKMHSQVAEPFQSSKTWFRHLWRSEQKLFPRTMERALIVPWNWVQEFLDIEDLSSGNGGNRVHIQIWLTKPSNTVIKAQSQMVGWQQMAFSPLSRLWEEAGLQILCGRATEQSMVCALVGSDPKVAHFPTFLLWWKTYTEMMWKSRWLFWVWCLVIV